MKSSARFARYFLVGGTSAVVDIGLFLILIRLGISYQLAGVLGFIVATAVNFILSKHYVFHDRQGVGFRKMIATYLVSSVGLLLNQLILWIGIEQFFLAPLLAKLVATGMVFFWNYFIRNYYVFKKHA